MQFGKLRNVKRRPPVSDPDALITLAEAAAFVPGADAETLKRRIRQGKLSATRPGKAYLTTLADVRNMIEACRVTPKVRDYGCAPRVPTAQKPLGSSLMEHASAGLDLALAQAKARRLKR